MVNKFVEILIKAAEKNYEIFREIKEVKKDYPIENKCY
jgi:hypothetical protein